MRGIARDLAAAGLGKLKPLTIKKVPGTFASPIQVEIKDKAACPVYVGRYIKGVDNKAETPKWMKDRLAAIGLHSISPLVDVTNYINYVWRVRCMFLMLTSLRETLPSAWRKRVKNLLLLRVRNMRLTLRASVFAMMRACSVWAALWVAAEKGCTADTINVFVECALFDRR